MAVAFKNKTAAMGEGKPKNGNGYKKGFFSAFRPVHIIIISIAAALILGAVIFVAVFSRAVTCEAGDAPDYSHITENSLVSFFCKLESDLEAIDTSKPAEIKVQLKFFGFIKTRSKLTVADTVCPEVAAQNVYVTKGLELSGEMFTRKVSDKTAVTFEFVSGADSGSVGTSEVRLKAVDEGGNITEFDSVLMVVDAGDSLVFEYGVTNDEIKEKFLSVFTEAETVDMSAVIDCGEFVLTGENGDAAFFAAVKIADTKAPTAEVSSFDIVLGETLSEEEIVKNINDHSEVTVEFLSVPDYTKAGEHQVKVSLCDAFGNSTEYVSYVRIHDIETNITAEMGSSNAELAKLIFKDSYSESELVFQNDKETRGMNLGENEFKLLGKYGLITVKVTLEDTLPPDFSVQTMNYLVGNAPKAKDFVSSYEDSTAVTFSFKNTPDSSKEGSFDVIIVATDEAGNTDEKTASVVFYRDTVPPVINGQRDFYLIVGEKCNFAAGVTAYDAVWGEVTVNVDSSAVNMNAAGAYSLKYTATDGSGNTAEATVTVSIRDPLRVSLNIPCMMQKPALPNGCEIVSLAMALKYNGYTIDPVKLFNNFMPKSPYKDGDPWTSYVGDPTVKGQGYGCFAPCVVETGNKYLASVGSSKRMRDVSGQSFSYYESLIDKGVPVMLWGTTNMSGNPRVCWKAEINGKNVSWLSASHCLLLIGYTDYTYIFCDPLKGVTEYDKSDVEKSFNLNFRQACIVE